jgi:hypothetical protein
VSAFCCACCNMVLALHFIELDRGSSSSSLLYTFIPCSPAFNCFSSTHPPLHFCCWISLATNYLALRRLLSMNWLFYATVSRFAAFSVINHSPLVLSRSVIHVFLSLLSSSLRFMTAGYRFFSYLYLVSSMPALFLPSSPTFSFSSLPNHRLTNLPFSSILHPGNPIKPRVYTPFPPLALTAVTRSRRSGLPQPVEGE